MTEQESKILMAEATTDIIRTCKPEQKDFWIEMRRMLLYASAEEFDKYCEKIADRDDFIEVMCKLSIQTSFVKMLNDLGSRGDGICGLESEGVFQNPIKEEDSDLWQVSHLTEDRIKRYNTNGTEI